MTELRELTDDELLAEVQRRGLSSPARGLRPRCPCGKWSTYVGNYDVDGLTTRCHGCLRATTSCTC